MTFNTIELLSIFSVFLFLFFASYLLSLKTKNRLSNTLFAVYLIVVALDLTAFFYSKFISLTYTAEMLRMEILAGLKSPILYLYILSLLYNNFRLKYIHLLFFLPLLINLSLLFPSFFNLNTDQQKLFFENYTTQPVAIFTIFFGYAVSYVFLFLEIYQVKRYREIVTQNYTNADALINYTWLRQFLLIDVVLLSITFIKSIYRFTTENPNTMETLRVVILLLLIVFISWLFNKALFAPKIFQGIDTNLTPIKESTTQVKDERIKQITQFILDHKPYLNASLTLQELSSQLNIPSKELSNIINQQIGKHFFDYINEFRINDAKFLLKEKPTLTVLEILYDVGFNSKSSFYTAFKKETQQTPTTYRKSNI